MRSYIFPPSKKCPPFLSYLFSLIFICCYLLISISRDSHFVFFLSGVAFGRGTYFATDAKYSIRNAEGGGGGRLYMYLARVLVGQYCVGNSSMIVPPAKNKLRPEILYESVVDDNKHPSIFVVFCDNQSYPEYLITIGEGFFCR